MWRNWKDGYSNFSTCGHYNYDRDVWNFRHQIMDAIISRGYLVSSVVRHGVTDVTITKKLNLS